MTQHHPCHHSSNDTWPPDAMWFRRVPGWQQEVKGWERGRDAPCSHGPRVEAGIAGGLGEWELGVAVTSILLAALQPLPTTHICARDLCCCIL